MPNHVYQTVTVSGNLERIKEFFANHFSEEKNWEDKLVPYFDFSTFLPMPEELEGTTSPCEPNRELRAKYGADNWYDWKVKNWGTKWGAYDCEMLGETTFAFQTAWSMPEPIFALIAEKYPDLVFEMEVVEEGGFFAGPVTIVDGEVDYSKLTDDSDTWKRYAEEYMGWTFDDED